MNATDTDTPALIPAVCASLREAIDAAMAVTTAQYSQRHPDVDADSIGAHLRHHLEHVELLLNGAISGEVNYDARQRDPRLQSDPKAAIARCRELLAQVAALKEAELTLPLRLVQQVDVGSCATVELQTTLGRELLFMHSHAVHHHAIIAILLKAFGHRMRADFGVMPSTTVWRRQESCGRDS